MRKYFEYWDPNLFVDDDGRVYFYWGCSSNDPIKGVELYPEKIGEENELFVEVVFIGR